jgi:hypothetical protein
MDTTRNHINNSRFYFLWKCGCVISKKAIEELNMKKACIVCGEKVNMPSDLVNLNMSKEDKENLYNTLTSEKTKKRAKPEDNLLGKKREFAGNDELTANSKVMVNPLGLSQISTVQKK